LYKSSKRYHLLCTTLKANLNEAEPWVGQQGFSSVKKDSTRSDGETVSCHGGPLCESPSYNLPLFRVLYS
jgi:hypothetical protein